MRGEGMDAEMYDEAINALALICALLLTIPFGILPSLNMDYWEKVNELSKDCPEYNYSNARRLLVGILSWSIILSIAGLVLCSLYYVLKPKHFEIWLKQRGKYLLILGILATFASFIVLLIVFGNYFAYFNVNRAQYCKSIVDGWFTGTTLSYIGAFVITSLALLM
eukprot:GILI01016930.1.p1 GENE.GILI01016930.1~~GILI01016930.1.p1  ORF type:complete len:166 (-),score=9.84 GILI01016930.1:38-535(-)